MYPPTNSFIAYVISSYNITVVLILNRPQWQPTHQKRKNIIYTYWKLKSFEQASADVQQSISDVVNDDDDLKDTVEVLDYDGVNQRTLDSAYTVTAIVVIDSRQTRTLITPERRDPNVDHWDELNMLYREKTKPKGSILIMIYGDEWSKDLPGKELVAKSWQTVWKFNDETALSLVAKNRCFSIHDEFTEFQKEKMRKYIKFLPFIPQCRGSRFKAVVGDKATENYSKDIICNYLAKHPFMSSKIEQETAKGYQEVQVIRNLSFISTKKENEVLKTAFLCSDDVPELFDGLATEESKADLEQEDTSKLQDSKANENTEKKNGPRSLRNVLQGFRVTRVKKCTVLRPNLKLFSWYYADSSHHASVKRQLEKFIRNKVGITISNIKCDVLPLLPREDCLNSARALVENVVNETEDKLCTIEDLDDDEIIDLYRLYALTEDFELTKQRDKT
ncbi:uncharacterized protein LOC144444343 [Glandiceps talaboti]